ncbi:hypothetical protein [Collinsella aerofaciens]|uniref:hypothetical protein n=1 Tax=Collinsella aerofaciens TaxID=74426 RepID=UPI003D7BDC08
MIENPITESMIETGLRSGAITVENDCGELIAYIGDGYIICGDTDSDETPEPLSMVGEILDVLNGFAADETPDDGFADELNYYFAYLSEVNPPDASAESLDEMMEQKAEVAWDSEIDEGLGVSNEER